MNPLRLTLLALLILTAGTAYSPTGAFDPGKPRNLKGDARGPNVVELDWRKVSGSEGYYVYRDGNRVAEVERSAVM